MSHSEVNLWIILFLSPVNDEPQIHLLSGLHGRPVPFQAVVEGQHWVANSDTQALYSKYNHDVYFF